MATTRPRTILTGIGTALMVCIVIAAIAGTFYKIEWTSAAVTGKGQRVLCLEGGCATLWWYHQALPTNNPGWHMESQSSTWRWLPSFGTSPGNLDGFVEVPLWVPLLVIAVTSALFGRKCKAPKTAHRRLDIAHPHPGPLTQPFVVIRAIVAGCRSGCAISPTRKTASSS